MFTEETLKMKWYRLYKESNDSDFIIKDGVLEKYKGKGGDVVIPKGVTSINNLAFYGFTWLKSVTIPNSVTNIGSHAFLNCSGLTSVTIPDGVTSIGKWAFYGCNNLTSITVKGKRTEDAKNLLEDAVDDISIVHGEPTKYTIDYTAWHMDKYSTEITANSEEEARRKFLRDEAQEQYDMKDFEITSIRES